MQNIDYKDISKTGGWGNYTQKHFLKSQLHNLGQFYIIIDPTSRASFYNRLEELTAVISSEEGTRMPGQYTVPQTEVDVPDDLWNLAIGLSKAKHSE